jgi:hypothetical protein
MKEHEVPTREEIWNIIKNHPREDWDAVLIEAFTSSLPGPTLFKLRQDLISYDHPVEVQEDDDAGRE